MSAPRKQKIKHGEFVALMALMFATIAFSIDALLPAIPQISEEVTAGNTSHATWILTFFVAGMGLGTLFCGPLSDAYGRKTIIYMSAILYLLGAYAAWSTSSLGWMLFARFIQGIGAAGPRIVSVAIIRDLYVGREMARILSIVMAIFILVPAIAPSMSVLIISLFDWRAIFLAFILFALIVTLWTALRLNEPLGPKDRRPLTKTLIREAVLQIFSNKTVLIAIFIQTLILAMLFSTLTMLQPIYDQVFDKADSFPFWFGSIALLAGGCSLLNSVLVVRFGMRNVVYGAMRIFLIQAVVVIAMMHFMAHLMFPIFLIWQFFLFSFSSLTMGNLNALAMEPMGHIAGMAASVIGAVSTICSALIATPMALAMGETPLPLIFIVTALSIAAFGGMRALNAVSRS